MNIQLPILPMTDLQQAKQNFVAALRMAWLAGSTATLVILGATLIEGVIQPIEAWLFKLIIDKALALSGVEAEVGGGLQSLLILLAVVFGLRVIDLVGGQCRKLATRVLTAKLTLNINLQIIQHALKLDLSFFEDTVFYDKLQNARQQVNQQTSEIITRFAVVLRQSIILLLYIALLIQFSPWLLVFIVVALIPSLVVQKKYADLTFDLFNHQATGRRQMAYIEYLLTVDTFNKEIKLFQVGQTLLKRYVGMFNQMFRDDLMLRLRYLIAGIGWGIVALIGFFSIFAWVILSVVDGSISVGEAVMYLMIFVRGLDVVKGLFTNLVDLYENTLYLSNLFSFLNLKPKVVAPVNPRPVPATLLYGIEFRNVSFRYPGSDRWVLRNIDLTLRPGQKVAFVGKNGVGKTTLVKLLTRLYDPTEGQILVDGVDLREYDPVDWHQKIGVIFQDFVQYQLSAAENIGFGQIENATDRMQVERAAQMSGADDIISRLPKGYESTLGTWFENGCELSGGQWQKVALGRAFMRDSEVLILDEPTAALDAQHEYEIFQQFRELTQDKLSILISHRFSTVRLADTIIVIENGRVKEMGCHSGLMALEGSYAELFNLQAEGYR